MKTVGYLMDYTVLGVIVNIITWFENLISQQMNTIKLSK